MARKTNGAAPKATQIETMERRCPVALTEAERVARGDEMADCEVKIEALKDRRTELGRTVRMHEQRRNELAHALDAGVEDRDLTCSWVPDYPKNVFRLTRPDTGEVVDTRPMTAGDRQADLLTPPTNGATPMHPPPRSPRAKHKPGLSPDEPSAA